MLRELFFLIASLLITSPAQVQEEETGRLLIRQVAVSGGFVVFSYAGDLWRVSRAGGEAEQLTVGPWDDDYPVFAPDGMHLAFSRRDADDWDVYVMGTQGGEPQRLTYNPEADIARGWTPDGLSVLFMSHRDEEFTFRLYSIAENGPFPTPLPLPRGWEGSFEPDGKRIAYVPFARPGELIGVEWRQYRGGMTSPIWIAELSNSEIEKVPRDNSNDRFPMWMGGSVYFVSDRSGTNNLHVYDPQTQSIEQLTEFEGEGIRHASAGGGVIAFVRDGGIGLFHQLTREVEWLEVTVDPDRSELEPRSVEGALFIQSAALSSSGDQVVFGVRGDVVTYDTETGATENLTQASGIAERYPTPSPDGNWIAYVSDESGEYDLRIRSTSDGSVIVVPIAMRPSFYRDLKWSPDSKRLAFSDKRLSLWVADVETGGASRIATSTYAGQHSWQPAWSPDGIWLAYSQYEANRLRAVYVYHAERGRKRRVTDGQTHSEHPAFDKSGRYLYFVASNTAALGEFGWNVLSSVLYRPLISRRLHLIVLGEGMPAPILAGEPNPEAGSGAPGVAARSEPGEAPPASQEAGTTTISLRGITRRVVPIPLPAKDYAGLIAGEAGELFVLVTEWPDSPAPGQPASRSLHRWDLNKPQLLERVLEDIDEFELSSDRTKVLYRRGGSWGIVSVDEAAASGDGRLDLSSLQIEVDPQAEWDQIYHETWRLMRDYFYDPNHHGQDLRAIEAHYATYLPNITRRHDLNLLLGDALGQISVSYLGVGGGALPPPAGAGSQIGLLGANYDINRERYRFTRIHRSGHYNSGDPLLSAPLDQPGVRVQEGEYLISVNGTPILASENLYSYFAGTAARPVQIEVAPEANGKDSRTYTVVPLSREGPLRRMSWAERNRQMVDSLSNGVLGYVYVPNFGPGLEAVIQQLLGDINRRGFVVDQRFAVGGITSDFIIEMLGRSPAYYNMFREGEDIGVPAHPMPRSKVLIINNLNASEAETFAFMWKQERIGTVVGTRTWGAGTTPYVPVPELVDGGRVAIPNRAAYDPSGDWGIENQGVDPDIEVEWPPADWRRGIDTQLGAAVRAALQLLIDNPPVEVKRPDYPVRQE